MGKRGCKVEEGRKREMGRRQEEGGEKGGREDK